MGDAVTSDTTMSATDKVKTALSKRAIATCPMMEMYFDQ